VEHIGLTLTGALILLVTMRISLVRLARPPLTHGPRPVPLPIPVVVRVLRDDDELEHARGCTTACEHPAATLRWARSERCETRRDLTIEGELTCRR
jgi:hypothetical protein